MFYISQTCPFCKTGPIGFRACSDGTVVLMCGECDSVWLDPRAIELNSMVHVVPPDFVIPRLGCSVARPSARWASLDEINASGGGPFVAGEDKTFD